MHKIPPHIDWAARLLSPDFLTNQDSSVIDQVMHWTIQALKNVEPQVTLAHLAVFFQSEQYRDAIVTQIQDEQVCAWWHEIYPSLPGHQALLAAAHWRVDQWAIHHAVVLRNQCVTRISV